MHVNLLPQRIFFFMHSLTSQVRVVFIDHGVLMFITKLFSWQLKILQKFHSLFSVDTYFFAMKSRIMCLILLSNHTLTVRNSYQVKHFPPTLINVSSSHLPSVSLYSSISTSSFISPRSTHPSLNLRSFSYKMLNKRMLLGDKKKFSVPKHRRQTSYTCSVNLARWNGGWTLSDTGRHPYIVSV